MYGRGEKSIADQLGCSVEEARDIKNNVYTAFPRIKEFEKESADMVREKGYVTTLWGRKRRLGDYNLPAFRIFYVDKDGKELSMPVPQSEKNKIINEINNTRWNERESLHAKIKARDGIDFEDNQSKIAAAGRQIINSRVQGCLDGFIKIKSKEYGLTEIKNHVNETLTLWDGESWTPGTIIESGKKQKCIITLENGSQFICSPDHKFRVTLLDGTKVWKKCSELTEDDNIDEDIL